MQRIVSSEKDIATDSLEKRLLAAADEFRASRGLRVKYIAGIPAESRAIIRSFRIVGFERSIP